MSVYECDWGVRYGNMYMYIIYSNSASTLLHIPTPTYTHTIYTTYTTHTTLTIQIELIKKNNSTKHAPNGKIPPQRAVMNGCRYHGWEGICLGMLDVTTGYSTTSHL